MIIENFIKTTNLQRPFLDLDFRSPYRIAFYILNVISYLQVYYILFFLNRNAPRCVLKQAVRDGAIFQLSQCLINYIYYAANVINIY